MKAYRIARNLFCAEASINEFNWAIRELNKLSPFGQKLIEAIVAANWAKWNS